MLPANQTTGGSKQESRWLLMLTALRYPDFRLVWIGSMTEHFGEAMYRVTVLWMVNEMTHSPLMLTIVGSCGALAMLVFPILGGVLADRMNRRNLLMAALVGLALLYISLALLVVADSVAIWHLIVIALLHGVATSFNHPARQTIVPNLVRKEHLLNAISLDTFSVSGLGIVAMPLAGYLIAYGERWSIFIIAAVCAVIPIGLLCFIKTPLTPPAIKGQTIILNLTAGFRYMRSHLMVLGLLLLYAVPTVTGRTVGNFLPVVAEDILNVGAVGYGYLQTASALGGMFTLIGLAMLTYYQGKHKLLLVAGIILGVALLGFSASHWFLLSLPLLVVIVGMDTILMAITTTLIQASIPDEMRGRIMSWREIAMSLAPAGVIGLGAIAQDSGVPFSFGLLAGTAFLFSFLLAVLLPKIKSLEQRIVT